MTQSASSATPSVLVTGGAGYIGSHIVKQLAQAGERVVIIDDLSTGYAENILAGELIIGNCGDRTLLNQVLQTYQVKAVIHLAASIVVPESLQKPLHYYQNNVVNTCHLIESCLQAEVKQFIFSSSAAVYGQPEKQIMQETDPCAPLHPYGHSKLFCERMLQDISLATPLRYVALRYFNVGGADAEARIGLRNPQATTLIKVAVRAALGLTPQVTIYGTDYATPDGTGVRDYIHVDDIASAHLQALNYLRNAGRSITLNCGYGQGYSVRQVLDSVQRLAGVKLQIEELPRRPGDPQAIIADNSNILKTLAWRPQLANLDQLVMSSLKWERKLAGLH